MCTYIFQHNPSFQHRFSANSNMFSKCGEYSKRAGMRRNTDIQEYMQKSHRESCRAARLSRGAARTCAWNSVEPRGYHAARRETAPEITRLGVRAHNRAAPRDNRATRHEPAPELSPRCTITAQRSAHRRPESRRIAR